MAAEHRYRYVSVDDFKKSLKALATGEVLKTDDLVILRPSVPEVRALGGHDSRMVEFIITDESTDRMSDVIHSDGWDIDNYEKNPVVLFAHDHYQLPVGKAVTLDIDKKKKQVRSIAEFTPKDLYPLGYMVYQMYVQRFMHAVSVGFQPKEYTWVSSDSDAERARRGGIDFIKQELLEYSAVPVPANPNALAVARSAGIDTAPLKAWAEQVLDESSSKNLSDAARRRVEVLRAAASPNGRALILEIGEMKMAGTVVDDKKTTDLPPADDTTTKKADPPADAVVKRVVTERWACGLDTHAHVTEADARSCADAETTVLTLATQLDAFAGVLKAGRVLSAANEKRLRDAVAAISLVLDQLDAQDEEDEEGKSGGVLTTSEAAAPVVEEEGMSLPDGLDMDTLTAAVRSSVQDAVNTLTGRVD